MASTYVTHYIIYVKVNYGFLIGIYNNSRILRKKEYIYLVIRIPSFNNYLVQFNILSDSHEGNTMRKIMGNKPQLSSAIIIQSCANIL
jgi:uncharacterized membrane protein YiaA